MHMSVWYSGKVISREGAGHMTVMGGWLVGRVPP
jgi:hypothetical protein